MPKLFFQIALCGMLAAATNTPLLSQQPASDKSNTPSTQEPQPRSNPPTTSDKSVVANQPASTSTSVNHEGSYNVGTLILTFVIALCAAFQVLIYWRQTRIMQHTTDVIRRQAEIMGTQARDAREAFTANAASARETLEKMAAQNALLEQSVSAAEKSAASSAKSVAALQKLERPFLMIEVRGPLNNHVWAVNKGRVPAQIVWTEPVVIPKYLKFEEDMPTDYDYGPHYYNPDVEVINIPWLAPGGEKELTYLDYMALDELPDTLKKEINGGLRVIYFLSGLKYKGLLSDQIFESRWCFRWGGKESGLSLSGPYGYNKYT